MASIRTRWLFGGFLGLAVGYFFWYTPFATLTKGLSAGLLPGVDGQVGGLVLLPAAALGTLVGAVVFLALSGWWRYARRPPRPALVAAGFFMSIVIATTTLNYAFAGVSILFMLLMMRGGVLILSPLADAVRRRRVRPHSWLALGLSLLAVAIALSDVDSYHLTLGAALSLGGYLLGYLGRFEIMGRVAKTGDDRVDRRYLAEEQIAAAVWQVLLCAVVALAGLGTAGGALREGFTTFLVTPGVVPAFTIGLLYQTLFVYGTLIYLDVREYTWCVPANRCASLLSGVLASYWLAWATGLAAPGPGQLVATGVITLAILALSYPALAASLQRPAPPAGQHLVLFVCQGNTCRSAMAEAIARAELNGTGTTWRVLSAGIGVTPDKPIRREAAAALRDLGIRAARHRARPLTGELVRQAETVYCMTAAQCAAVHSLAPGSSAKIIRLDPAGDVADPIGQPHASYLRCARQIRHLVHGRLAEAHLHDRRHTPWPAAAGPQQLPADATP